MRSDMTGALRRIIVTLAVAAAASLATAANAQVGAMGGFGEIFKEDFSRRDLPIISSGLDLDEGQRFNVETLLEEYQEKVRSGVDKLRESFMARQKDFTTAAGNSQAVAQLVFEPLEEWATQKDQMKLQFIADLKEFLTPDQLERWPNVERKLNRISMLNDGAISGEGTDLFLLVQDLGLPPDQMEVANVVMEGYAQEMDQLLVTRAKALKAMRHESLTAMQGGADEGYRQAVERVITLRVAIREVNEKYVNSIAASLAPDAAAELRQAYREAAFPRIYRATRAERMIKAALESPQVSSAQKSLVEALKGRYDTEMATANESLIKSVKQSDPQRERARALDMFTRMTAPSQQPPQGGQGAPGGPGAPPQPRARRAGADDPLKDDFRKRDELENRYLMELATLLGPELFDSLPGAGKGGGAAAAKDPITPQALGASGPRSRSNSGDADGSDGSGAKSNGNAPPVRKP